MKIDKNRDRRNRSLIWEIRSREGGFGEAITDYNVKGELRAIEGLQLAPCCITREPEDLSPILRQCP